MKTLNFPLHQMYRVFESCDITRGVQKILQDCKSLKDIIAILGMDEMSEKDKLKVARARRSGDSCPNLPGR